MSVLYVFRIAILLVGIACIYLFARLLSKRSLKGARPLGLGLALVALSLLAGDIFSGDLLSWPPGTRGLLAVQITTIILQPVGILMLLVGAVQLIHSLKPHLDSSLVESSFVGVFIVEDGILEFVNSRFVEILGYQHEEVVGRPMLDFIAPAFRTIVDEKNKLHEKDRRDHLRYEAKVLKKDGEEIYVEIISNRTIYEGNPAIQGTLIDNTTRRQALQVILASEERFRTLAKSSYDIISEHDAEGVFLYLSPNIKEILGYEPYELISTPFFNYMHEADRAGAKREFQKIVSERTSGRVTFRYRSKRGEWLWIESTGRSYVTGSGQMQAILVSRDITNQRKMQEEIFKASKLESVGVLAGGIAHNFNNILTVILGNISLARSYFTVDDEEPLQVLSDAERACLSAQDLTAQFLTFAKGGEPVKKNVRIEQLLKDTIDLALRGSQAKCKYFFAEDLWHLEVDKGQINQVFHNLVINADQAMPGGGLIKVSATNENLSPPHDLPLPDGPYVRIVFSDEGVGISEKNLAKIFDPYFTTKKKGSGLGLATAYSIIKSHNGLLMAESFPGQGTTFLIYLPAMKTQVVSGKEESDHASDAGTISNGKVLIMDDEETIRKSVGRMLNRLGYEVGLAEDGEQAINLYRCAYETKRPFDAVLIDLTIPGGMGGKETIERLREFDPEIKAIVSSGYSNDPVMSDYEAYGFRNVIAKPYRFDSLGQIINETILNGHTK